MPLSDAGCGEAPVYTLKNLLLLPSVPRWFIPVLIVIAAATALVWWYFGPEPKIQQALMNAATVLIIACPCALALATPMPLMEALRRGARMGILFKNIQALATLGKIDTLVIDKTGTLTEGKPRVSSVVAANGFDEAAVLQLAASLDSDSAHPLAMAILQAAKEKKLSSFPAGALKVFSGKGVIGIVEGHQVALGTLVLLKELSIPADSLREKTDDFRHKGQTVIFVGIDKRVAGLIAISDPVRKTTAEALRALKESGLRILMLTGDNQTTAEAIGRKLGITEIEAGVTPERKAMIVRELQSKQYKVAVAGCSINDAPALAQADISIATTGAPSITLPEGDLMGIVHARRLGMATTKNIRQNLCLASIYNVLAIPVAAGALYPHFHLLLNPVIAGGAMTLSTIAVIVNTLRLRRVKI